ncbi:hypothetical protein PV327_008435 [Microctonus hyperodae]|uniref:Diphthamide biosynthesis protein 3 n=1 Tax=Microctonus hyperodae TaxID=165561 RepID=A0AA39KH77_MICHY|nr:hypothetical protein PV327_008435 [Microctonus hyperodae]
MIEIDREYFLVKAHKGMTVYHDEVEIEDFEYDEDEDTYFFPCPCGDQFQISKQDLIDGEEDATCPSCSLVVRVIYDKTAFAAKQEEIENTKNPKLIKEKA